MINNIKTKPLENWNIRIEEGHSFKNLAETIKRQKYSSGMGSTFRFKSSKPFSISFIVSIMCIVLHLLCPRNISWMKILDHQVHESAWSLLCLYFRIWFHVRDMWTHLCRSYDRKHVWTVILCSLNQVVRIAEYVKPTRLLVGK